jgi:N-acetylglucosaminyldiphosphoundecaprenol N-acetyl-beta-D-mannosaminyltransferase
MAIVRNRGVANFLGVELDALTYEEMYELVDVWIADKTSRSHHIACVNAYCVTLANKFKRLKEIYNRADIVGADGMPFVRWIRIFNKLSCDRFAAPDIILKLAEHSKVTGYTFFLYGGDDDVVVKMKYFLEERFPHIKIVGYWAPPFRPLSKQEDEFICSRINDLQPDIICVGLGTPKQDYWIDEHIEKIKGSVFVASGATFDFFGGRIRMAPTWIRHSGFEWLYRLLGKDFKRLWRRYTIGNVEFIILFSMQLLTIQSFTGNRAKR